MHIFFIEVAIELVDFNKYKISYINEFLDLIRKNYKLANCGNTCANQVSIRSAVFSG